MINKKGNDYMEQIKKSGKIYLQIYSKIKEKIEKRELKGRLPSVRKLAEELGISPSTVVRAYDELEKNGFVSKKEGSGVYVKFQEKKNLYLEDHMESETFRYGYFNPDFQIDFASATPNETLLPVESLKKAINFVLDRDKESAFLYEDPQGYYYLRKTISEKLKKEEVTDIPVKNIQIVSGAQQGIDIISEAVLYPDDIVVVEEPTYRGAKESFKKAGCRVLEVSMQKDGFSLRELEKILYTKKIKLFYTMTNFQNPTGISMSQEKKEKFLKLAEKYDFYILEDDGLSNLYFGKEKPHTLKSMDKNQRVIYIKSYSKIFMPGLRLAYIAVPDSLIYSITNKKFSADICHSALNQRAFQFLLENGDWDIHMEKARNLFKKKQKLMYKCLKKIKGIKFRKPEGGLCFWLELPENIWSKAVYVNMLSKGVGILPGIVFSEDRNNFIRISFAQCEEKEIEEGVRLLGESLERLKD